jgi:GTP-binding protein EngB required for normal cell division
MEDKKDKILSKCNIVPVKTMVKYLRDGMITMAELRSNGLTSEREEEINNEMVSSETVIRKKATKLHTPQAYNEYLTLFPEGKNAAAARDGLASVETDWWNEISIAPTAESLNSYLAIYPNGQYVYDAKSLLNDIDWLETCRINTQDAYISYRDNNPGKHTKEISEILISFNDATDWEKARMLNTTDAYREYILSHPNGKWVPEANKIINSRKGHDTLLNGIRADKNYKSAEDIQRAVSEGTITRDELVQILGEQWTKEILSYNRPPDLPIYTSPIELQKGRTEVYFWGTPASGKTCTLGAVLSSAYTKGKLFKKGGALEYMDGLKNIFNPTGISRLPNSTSNVCIYDMNVDLKDEKDRMHPITMIDLAGEIFKCIYFSSQGIELDDDRQRILTTTFNYLKDRRNKKIMFFVVEYDGHDRVWDDNTNLNMSDYLDRCLNYLNDLKVISNSVNGIYVLVTKSDKIACEYKEQAVEAQKYVEKYFKGFWETLKEISKSCGVKDLKVIPFSVGNVVAKQLCEYNGKYASLVINNICKKSESTGRSFLDFLRG